MKQFIFAAILSLSVGFANFSYAELPGKPKCCKKSECCEKKDVCCEKKQPCCKDNKESKKKTADCCITKEACCTESAPCCK